MARLQIHWTSGGPDQVAPNQYDHRSTVQIYKVRHFQWTRKEKKGHLPTIYGFLQSSIRGCGGSSGCSRVDDSKTKATVCDEPDQDSRRGTMQEWTCLPIERRR